MLNSKMIHEIEQAMAGMLETVPLMYQFYKSCLKEGFSSDQSFEIMRDVFTRRTLRAKDIDEEGREL